MITLNSAQQDHIAYLILDHHSACESEDRIFAKWLETDSERAQKAFVRASQHRKNIEAELLERYGIDIQGAITRQINKAA